ncbi:MAG: hypothetical protein JXR77_08445, partial [Lentisphaeria bacterium]|nr:hypothetical protein [Lentisphaeria bacterium]
MKHGIAWNVAVYALLIAGSAIFSLPFVWMVSTSVKVDRELFAPGLNLLPSLPRPRLQSPYIDPSLVLEGLPETEPGIAGALLPLVRERAATVVPDDLPPATWEQDLCLAVCAKLRRSLPTETWNRGPEAVAAAAVPLVTTRLVSDLFGQIHRRLSFGPLRVRSLDRREEVLGNDRPVAERLQNLTPQVATVTRLADAAAEFASIRYDFSRGDRITLSETYRVGFPTDQLERVQLYLKPDDTWHQLDMTLETAGKRYRAEHRIPLANETWTMLTWQKPGPDDHSTKIKTWVLLHEEPTREPVLDEPSLVRLTLDIHRTSPLGACLSKITRNYTRVLEHIPFWRYVRVSLFLVIVNVVLTVFACSLVAYAFARLTWPGRNGCFLIMLATLMIPGQVTMIPHFLIWRRLGMYDTLLPLWLGHLFGNAFFIFLLRQFLKGIPRDLEDAARIDGCG